MMICGVVEPAQLTVLVVMVRLPSSDPEILQNYLTDSTPE